MSGKRVLPERCAIVSSKGVLQECHLSVSTQGVSQARSLENVARKHCLCSSTYVSAFGFVGFILFDFCAPFLYNFNMFLCFCLFVCFFLHILYTNACLLLNFCDSVFGTPGFFASCFLGY